MKAKVAPEEIKTAKKMIFDAVTQQAFDGEDNPIISIEYKKQDQAAALAAMNELIKDGMFGKMRTNGNRKYFKYLK